MDRELVAQIMEPVPPCTVNEIFEGVVLGSFEFEEIQEKANNFNFKEIECEEQDEQEESYQK